MMVRYLLMCVMWGAGCGGSGLQNTTTAPPSSDTAEVSVSETRPSDDPSSTERTTEDTSSTGGTTLEDPVQTCLPACTSAADCSAGIEAYDEDNYACVEGGCVYTGCIGDDECRSLGDYVCRDVGPLFVCQPACERVSDCDLGLAPYDADNYACVEGGCDYLGCLSDEECQDLGAYACASSASGIRYCAPACSGVNDCVQAGAAYDEDNYACDEGACVYLGCQSDKECKDVGDFVCGESIP